MLRGMQPFAPSFFKEVSAVVLAAAEKSKGTLRDLTAHEVLAPCRRIAFRALSRWALEDLSRCAYAAETFDKYYELRADIAGDGTLSFHIMRCRAPRTTSQRGLQVYTEDLRNAGWKIPSSVLDECEVHFFGWAGTP